MTTRFALISEGITDQVYIRKIIHILYKNKDVLVNALQPEPDATDSSKQAPGTFGGWENVLNFCESSELMQLAVLNNDFTIIQIDTDQCHHINFNISKHIDGVEKTSDQLVADVIEFIRNKIPIDILKDYGEKIIYAIAVDSLECWITPLYSNEKFSIKFPRSCENKLNLALSKKNIDYNKTFDAYRKILSILDKRRITNSCKINKSLSIFINSLPNI